MVKITAIYVFSHPDYTVGSGITPDRASAHQALSARGLYRRLGIMRRIFRTHSPCPKDCFRYIV